MKRRRKRRKRKSAGKTTHHHQQRAAGRHTSTHLIYYYYDSLIKLGDACDCERVSRQAGRQGENPRRKSPRESPDCPPHARQKSNLDASLVEPRLFQSFCLCDAGLLSVGWLPLGNEPRSPDPRARRRRLIPRFSSCVCSGSWRGDFSSALSLSLSLSLPPSPWIALCVFVWIGMGAWPDSPPPQARLLFFIASALGFAFALLQ